MDTTDCGNRIAHRELAGEGQIEVNLKDLKERVILYLQSILDPDLDTGAGSVCTSKGCCSRLIKGCKSCLFDLLLAAIKLF